MSVFFVGEQTNLKVGTRQGKTSANIGQAEAQNCKALSPSFSKEQAALIRAAIAALAAKDVELVPLRAQVTKDANRLDWPAGVVQPDDLRTNLCWGGPGAERDA